MRKQFSYSFRRSLGAFFLFGIPTLLFQTGLHKDDDGVRTPARNFIVSRAKASLSEAVQASHAFLVAADSTSQKKAYDKIFSLQYGMLEENAVMQRCLWQADKRPLPYVKGPDWRRFNAQVFGDCVDQALTANDPEISELSATQNFQVNALTTLGLAGLVFWATFLYDYTAARRAHNIRTRRNERSL